jgi:hypothetical protein
MTRLAQSLAGGVLALSVTWILLNVLVRNLPAILERIVG